MGDGSTLDVIDTGFGRLGGLICWENYMPLARAALYARGIDIYLAPTWDNSDVWVPTLRHIGKEGRTYVIGVTSCIRATDLPADLPGRADLYGGAEDWLSRGNTTIIGPGGEVLACSPARKASSTPRSIPRPPGPAASSSTRPGTTAAATSCTCPSTAPRARPSHSATGTAPLTHRARPPGQPHRPPSEEMTMNTISQPVEVPMNSASVPQTGVGEPAVRDGVLVNGAWLEAHLHDPAVRVVEVDVSRRAYDDWHIDGAVLWNVYTDLKDAGYRLASRPALEQLLRRSGIRPDTTVVCYGYAPAMGFWLMKLCGHHDVRILDCSRSTWQRAGRPRSAVPAAPTATSYPLGRQDERIRAWPRRRAAGHRRPGQHPPRRADRGRIPGERFWPSGGMEPGGRAGHVPTAVHQPIDGLQDDQGTFRPTAELRRVFPAVRPGDPGELITYCTIGGRASTAWFVLTYLLGPRSCPRLRRLMRRNGAG